MTDSLSGAWRAVPLETQSALEASPRYSVFPVYAIQRTEFVVLALADRRRDA